LIKKSGESLKDIFFNKDILQKALLIATGLYGEIGIFNSRRLIYKDHNIN